jgi:NAD(P)-dependent dehydrogenase (short-subunit alcohol dehydrogenase family)
MEQRGEAMTAPFEGRVALVTGAAGKGCGSAICRRLAADGAAIAAVDTHEGRLGAFAEELREEHGTRVFERALDITDRPVIREFTRDASQSLGTIDILVNNAAINVMGSVFEFDPEDFDRVVAVDLTACWYLIHILIGPMRQLGRGGIVNVSSTAAYVGGRGMEAPYSAAKAALNDLTRSTAIEGGPFGIRCNGIAVGVVQSKFLEKHPEIAEDTRRRTPLDRCARPEEIASAAAFLLSEESSFITGEILNVSGGMLLGL